MHTVTDGDDALSKFQKAMFDNFFVVGVCGPGLVHWGSPSARAARLCVYYSLFVGIADGDSDGVSVYHTLYLLNLS